MGMYYKYHRVCYGPANQIANETKGIVRGDETQVKAKINGSNPNWGQWHRFNSGILQRGTLPDKNGFRSMITLIPRGT